MWNRKLSTASVGVWVLLASCLSAAEKPNIVLILADDMGYGDPTCYNPNSRIPTPNVVYQWYDLYNR